MLALNATIIAALVNVPIAVIVGGAFGVDDGADNVWSLLSYVGVVYALLAAFYLVFVLPIIGIIAIVS